MFFMFIVCASHSIVNPVNFNRFSWLFLFTIIVANRAHFEYLPTDVLVTYQLDFSLLVEMVHMAFVRVISSYKLFVEL